VEDSETRSPETLYDRLISEVFRRHGGAERPEFEFTGDEMRQILAEWGQRIRNLADVYYTYRGGRRTLPVEIAATGNWVIEGKRRGVYAFRRLRRSIYVKFPADLQAIDILDATPDIILKYGGRDEQGLLAGVRYNRLVDTFLGVTAYHLQGHVRTTLAQGVQIEIDDIYFGVDADGVQYVVPVEAKSTNEPLGVLQVSNLNAFAHRRYPDLKARSVAVKDGGDGTLFFAEFCDAMDCEEISVVSYKRYRLVREEEYPRR